jgi:4-hydroxybenzoate polyprenyltransferase
VRRLRAFIRLLRPHQWVKNAFVLVGLVFGHGWRDPALLWPALAATAAFCLASGAVYAFNDACDAERDRDHPEKRARPVARGAVAPGEARALAALAAAASLCLGAWAGWRVAAILAAYLALSAAYSVLLKRVAVLEVVVIAAGFMLRLLAGTLGIGIAPSRWLLACGFLLTLFLGFAKRRAELEQLAEGAAQHRAVLEAYSLRFLDGALALCAAGMVVAYAWYTLAPQTARLHGTRDLVLTVPWVVLGTARYLFRLRYRGGGGDPAVELLRDPLLALSVAGWAATVLWVIG